MEWSLHSALAEHWHRGEWYKFEERYWLDLFLDGFNKFDDGDRDYNSVEFIYWMNGDNYAETIREHVKSKMSLRQWRECRGRPY
jgi:hypothetical protein